MFLTDQDIFSSHGQEVLSKKDNDPIGHTAIKLYFNLTGGEQHECQDIWNPSKFPPEIAEKLKDFDKYWGKTFAKHLQDDDLNYIMSNGPDEWKHLALKVIMDRFDGGSLYLSGLTSLPKGMKLPSYAYAPNLGKNK